MATFQLSSTYTTKITDMSINNQGFHFELTITRNDGAISRRRYRVGIDKTLTDEFGTSVYPDATVYAPNILGVMTTLAALANTLHEQAIADGKVAPC